MSKLTYSHRRLIILTSLSQFLSKETLTPALLLWETKYSENTLISMNDLIYELSNTLGINIDFPNFVKVVNATSLKTEDELLKTSEDLFDDVTQQNKIKDKNEILLNVFADFIKEWQSLLSPEINNNIKIYIIENLHKQNFNVRTSMFFLSWFSNKKIPMKIKKLDAAVLKKVVSLFYVACCEYAGPVDTDKLLNQVTKNLLSGYSTEQEQQLKRLL